jgi:hypothetical protein
MQLPDNQLDFVALPPRANLVDAVNGAMDTQ